jgi:hypothetical protein
MNTEFTGYWSELNFKPKVEKMHFGTSWLTRMHIAPILLLTGQ